MLVFPIELLFVSFGCLEMGSCVCMVECMSFEMIFVCMLHYKNTYGIRFDHCCLFYYSLIGILIHCGLTGILKGLFICICKCMCVCSLHFKRFSHSTEYTNMTFH